MPFKGKVSLSPIESLALFASEDDFCQVLLLSGDKLKVSDGAKSERFILDPVTSILSTPSLYDSDVVIMSTLLLLHDKVKAHSSNVNIVT
jgi:hypothetical protein